MRNYIVAANAALSGEGVYVGVVPIGGLIRRSAAEIFWDLNLKRDRAEEAVGPGI